MVKQRNILMEKLESKYKENVLNLLNNTVKYTNV